MALRNALRNLWNEAGGASEFAKRAIEEGVLIGESRQKIRSARIVKRETIIPIEDLAGNVYKGYIPGRNEFANLWRMSDGSWRVVTVPAFYANQPDFDIDRFGLRPLTSKGKHKGKPDPNARRIARIYKNDMCALGEGEERRIFRIQQITNDRVVIQPHNKSDSVKRLRSNPLREQGFRPVRVDAIGRVLDPGPFPP